MHPFMPAQHPAEHPLIAFYAGTGHDTRGRRLDDILAFSKDELEFTHDYIQWLFPLFERSGASPDAPVLDDETAHRFRRDQTLRRQLGRALDVMLDFYGLEHTTLAHASRDGAPRIVRSAAFAERSRVWLTPRNHNFLRLTRILKCLAIVHAAPLAQALLACLEGIAAEHPHVVGERTRAYWRDAVPRG